MQLNSKQQEAALHKDGPLLVLAGAGSGKTRVLTQRIVHLIREHGVSPWNIFAVTFTNKAAREMKSRIVKELGPSAESLWISTFHSSCLRILRRHAEKIGYQSQFAIYDTSDQKTLMKAVIKEMELNDKLYKPKLVLGHIDRAKNQGQKPSEFVTEGDYFLERISSIYEKYQQKLQENQAMDFGDLILNVLTLFKKNPEVLAEYQNQFHYLFVDEYQDTNPVQYELIHSLAQARKNLFVVGDDDQSIYKFRGADVGIILGFQNDFPEAKVVRLEQNYRSTQNILDAANAVIRKNASRLGKELWTDNSSGDKLTIFGADSDKTEAKFIGDEIEAKRDHISLDDVAVFYRTNSQSRSLEDEFRRRNIPYQIYGGMKFYDRAEVKDMLAYLRALINPADSVNIKRIINTPARGIGKTTLQKIDAASVRFQKGFWEILSESHLPEYEMALTKGTLTKLGSFVALIHKLNKMRSELPLSEFISDLFQETGYWQMLTAERSIEAESRKDNLMELVNVVEEYSERNETPTLEGFLDEVSLATDFDREEAEDVAKVTMMTVHLSKGLEYPTVFLTGMEEGLFPHARSLDLESEMEEERRLCYVGMTRAEKNLYLTFARERRVFGSPMFHFPSRFLEEIPEEVCEQKSLTRDRPLSSMQNARYNIDEFDQSSSYSDDAPQSDGVDYDYSQEEGSLQKGQPVEHQVFGRGKVQAFEGQGDSLKVTIKFQSGITKKLLWKHANLSVY